MMFQTQQTAELVRSLGEAILVDELYGGVVVIQDRYPDLHDRPTLPFVREPRCAPAQQAGNDTFDHGTAVASGTGKLDLVGGTLLGQASLGEHLADFLW